MTTSPQYLSVKWTVSRGRDTYGYNIVTLRTEEGKKYSCNGGGYDMVGTVFADWLQANYQDRLTKLQDQAFYEYHKDTESQYAADKTVRNESGLYGMTATYTAKLTSCKITLDGACGLDSMQAIARAIGLEIKRTWDRKGNTTGFIITDTGATA